MEHSYHLSNFLGGLIASCKKQKFQHKYRYTKFISNNCTLLCRLGLLVGFSKIYEKPEGSPLICTYLRYTHEGLSPVDSYKLYSSPGCSRFVSVHHLRHKYLLSSHGGDSYIVSTSSGLRIFTNDYQSLNGGKLLYKIR